LRERAGVTNETYGSMLNYAAATGQEVEGTISGFLGGAKALGLQANKVINVKQLLAETSKTSNAIKLSIVGGAEALGRAAAQAKMLGMTLDQVDKIAGSLLQFEDSISAELSAELLTGKELNLERARYAALTGDVETLSKEIAQNMGSSANFTNMNRIQQEALAKAVGMTREELADTLVEQEAFNTLGRKLTDEEKAAYEFAKEKYGLERAAKMVGEGELDNLMKQQSIQDRFNQSVEKLKEIFVSIADPILQIVSPLADLVSTVLPAINALLSPLMEGFRILAKTINIVVDSTKALFGYFTGSNKELTTMQAIIGSIATLYLGYIATVKAGLVWQGISAAFSERKALAENASKISVVAQRIAEGAALPLKAISAALSGTKAIAEVTAAEALTAGLVTIAIVGGLAMVAAAMSKAKSQTTSSMPDGIVDPDPKKGPILVTEKDRIQLDPEDKLAYDKNGKIKVGTDLFGEKKMSKDKMIPSSNVANKTTNITNNVITKALSSSKDTSKTTSLSNTSLTTSDKVKEVNTQLGVNTNLQETSKEVSKNALAVFKNIFKDVSKNISKDTSISKNISKNTSADVSSMFKNIYKDTSKDVSKDTLIATKDVSKNALNIFNKFFKNVSKEKEIANVAQNTFNNISKEKEIIKDIVKNVSANATKEIAKETNTFKISKTKEILSNDKIAGGLKDTNVLDKTLSYIDKTNNLKTETLRSNKLNQLASSSIDNLKVSNLISDKQQIEQDKEKNNIFSLLNKEKETTTNTAVTNDFLSKTTTLPESTINVTNNSSANKTADSTVNNNIVNSSVSNNIKLLRELTQSFQSLLEENKKQNMVLNQIVRKDSNVYIDSTKAGTANTLGSTNIGR
jgi:hypothetical protein